MKRALLLLAAMLLAGMPAPAHASEPEDDVLAEVAGCVSERGELAVLILMDESSSLQHNDGDNSRVTGALVAVDRLKNRIGAGVKPVSVRMRIDAFADEVKPGAWRDLATEENAIRQDIDGFKGRDDVEATDYVKAFRSANETLLQQVNQSRATGTKQPCQVLLWFTDGRFMPGGKLPSGKDSHQLCGPEGAVSALRSTGVTMLTVALAKENPPDEKLLREITGLDDGCGTRTAGSRGLYLSASDEPGLINAFARLITDDPVVELCRSDCRFLLEQPLRNFYVLIHLTAADEPLRLRPPRGQDELSLSAPGGSATVAGAALRWEWHSDRLVVLNGDLPQNAADGWTGEWRVDGLRVHSGQVYFTGDLQSRLVGEPVFLRGEPWRVRTEILAGGKPFTPGALDPLRPEVVVSISDGKETVSGTATADPARPATAEVTFDPPQWRATEVTVKIELKVRTPSGLDISPSPSSDVVAVRARLAVSPTKIRLPERQGGEPVRGTLAVTADTTPGCVWIDGRPTGVAPAHVQLTTGTGHDSAERCARVDVGKQVEVPFELHVDDGCRCLVTGTLPVTMEVAGERSVVDVEFEFVSKVDPFRFWLAVLAMALLTLVPLLVLFLVNWRFVARFANPRTMRVLKLNVDVTPAGVQWSERWWEQDNVPPQAEPPRRGLTAGFVEFQTKTPGNPFTPPWTRVTALGGRVLATPRSVRPGRSADGLPLDLTEQVVVTAEPERAYERFAAEVVIVLDEAPLGRARTTRLRGLVETAAARLRPPRPPDDQNH